MTTILITLLAGFYIGGMTLLITLERRCLGTSSLWPAVFWPVVAWLAILWATFTNGDEK